MAAGTWILYNTFKQRLLAGTANMDKAVKLKLVTTSYTPSLAHLSLTTSAIATNGVANSNPSSGEDTFTSGEVSLTATGNNYRLDCSATSVFTATGGTMAVGYLIIGEATDDQLVAYCDADTATTAAVDVTAGNTFTVTFPTSGIALLSGATS